MTYPRATGTPRGDARRRELLDAVADDVATHGLADFSLRRAARAAGTTHKVLLYHFAGADALLAAVVAELRARRIGRGVGDAVAGAGPDLATRLRAMWEVLTGPEETALLQAMGLALQDPERHAPLVAGSNEQYLDTLRALCPDDWSDARRTEVAQLVLAALRGLLLARRTGSSEDDVDAGLRALERTVAREIAAD